MPSFADANAKVLLFWQRMKPAFLGAQALHFPVNYERLRTKNDLQK